MPPSDPAASPGEFPFLSVVVPTIGREPGLGRCLAALAAQEYPAGRYEILVVADGVRVTVPEPSANGATVRLLEQDHAGPAAARNTGARAAVGDFVAFTDDDCAPEPGWLRALAARHLSEPASGLGGRVANGRPEDPYAEASQLLVDYLCGYFNRREVIFLTSNNMSFPRAPFLDIGGFDESFPLAAAEDRELCDRWVAGGGRLAYVEDARVAHHHPMSPARFCRQHFNYGRGAFSYHRRRLRRSAEGLRPEPLRFYADLLAYPARRGRRGVRWPALMILSQVANVAGYVRERLAARA